MTDALEMKAISDTVGVEEGAVRAIAAGADALCLGHDLFDESVALGTRRARRCRPRRPDHGGAARRGGGSGRRARRVDSVGVGAVAVDREAGTRSGADARFGSRVTSVSTVRPSSSSSCPRWGWRQVASRSSPASGFRPSTPDCEVRAVRQRADPSSPSTAANSSSSRATRTATRGSARAIEALTAREPDAIVVEIGLPYWRPQHAATYVATYGAARVNVEAAAEALYSGPRRGVEQSGSSPGS